MSQIKSPSKGTLHAKPSHSKGLNIPAITNLKLVISCRQAQIANVKGVSSPKRRMDTKILENDFGKCIKSIS
jgi:hypothetical protein